MPPPLNPDWIEKTYKVACPACKKPMKIKGTDKYKNGRPNMFWTCLVWPICETTLPANPDGSPRYEPVSEELKGLRHQCHEIFDTWWRDGAMSRSEAYYQLKKLLKISAIEAHFGAFDKARCERFLEIVNANPGRYRRSGS